MNRRSFIKLLAIQSISLLIGKKVYGFPVEKKTEVILTIDDGPRKTMKNTLEELGENNKNPAIFYVIGENLKNNYAKELAKNALTKGHLLGNHSYTHPNFSKISFETARKEIEKTEELIEEIHQEVEIPREIKLFRFPYGSENQKIKEYLKEKEYLIQGWDVDSNDWKYYSKEKKCDLENIMDNCKKAKNKDIVLLHELPLTSNYIIPFFANSEKYQLVLP
jgi:peptidoglycan/xylan/chitin deacetylase (PgdA/CDA1 family)